MNLPAGLLRSAAAAVCLAPREAATANRIDPRHGVTGPPIHRFNRRA